MLDIKPDFNRVITTLQHREPDRVPLAEADIDYEIMSKFLGKKVADADVASQVEFWTRAGYDYIALTVGMMQPGKVTENSAISKVIKKYVLQDKPEEKEEEAWNIENRSFIHNERDFEVFPWEEVAKLDLSKFYEVQHYLPEGMKIIALSGKIFTLSWMLMGFQNFSINLLLNPKFVAQVVKRIYEMQYKAIKEVVKIPNVAAVWAVDDLAFGTGPMINPKLFREYIFPWYKKFSQMCHENGKYFFFHSDGVLWELMDDLVDMGVDVLHPIDPTCMDIEEVKQKVGDKLCIIGNIPNSLLMNGTPKEVVELTKKRIKTLAPGGGYCMGSGNSIPEWAKIENYKAMIETTLKYGSYPIKL